VNATNWGGPTDPYLTLLSHKRLSLNISLNALSTSGTVVELLMHSFPNLTSLDVSDCELRLDGAIALLLLPSRDGTQAQQWTTLNMSKNPGIFADFPANVDDEVYERWRDALAGSPWSELILQSCNISNYASVSPLLRNKVLTKLDLAHNQLNDDGVIRLYEILRTLHDQLPPSPLREMIVDDNGVDGEGVAAIRLIADTDKTRQSAILLAGSLPAAHITIHTMDKNSDRENYGLLNLGES
jgi:hypothetical protein